MRPIAIVMLALGIGALASAAATELAGTPTGTEAPAATAPPTAAPAPLHEVTIDPNAKLPVCRRYVPTGSRIATKVCEVPSATPTAEQLANRDRTRRDFAEMRELQTLRRTQAQAEALRRANRQ